MSPLSRHFRYKAARTGLRSFVLRYRHRGLHPNDVFIASFPRSGTYWLRFQLCEVLTGRAADFGSINQSLPWIGKQREALPVLPGGGRLISTHEQYRTEYKKAIYLVRDVRDVVLSAYAVEKGMGLFGYPGLNALESYLVPFLAGEAIPFGSWQDHVRSWLGSSLASNGNLLVIRYEDMREDPAGILARVLTFLGISAHPHRIRKAIESNSLEKMRAKEDKARTLPKASCEEARFVRKGEVGGWRNSLPDRLVEIVQQQAGEALALAGYTHGNAAEGRTVSECHTYKPVAG
jgi:estrone sulfotransferase